MSLFVLLLCFSAVLSIKPIPINAPWSLQAWGLEGVVDPVGAAKIINVDLDDAVDREIIPGLKKAGLNVICYISTGTYEPEREALNEISGWNNIKGAAMGDWPEYWLNLNKLDAVKAIMFQRFKKAQAAGCDGIEGDNVDCYNNPKCYQDTLKTTVANAMKIQLVYNRWQADTAHSLGMTMGLKNAGDIAKDLQPYYDFAIVEQCVQYGDCTPWQTFTQNGKGVLVVEYKSTIKNADPCLTIQKFKFQGKVCAKSGTQTCPSKTPFRNCPSAALKDNQGVWHHITSPAGLSTSLLALVVVAGLVGVVIFVVIRRRRVQDISSTYVQLEDVTL